MLKFARKYRGLVKRDLNNLWIDQENKLLAFSKGGLVSLFNFHPTKSQEGFSLPVNPVGAGGYRVVFSTDDEAFGGQGRISDQVVYQTEFTRARPGVPSLRPLPHRHGAEAGGTVGSR
jgi:1,4-alpha-glucan branching enzyme